MRRAAKTDANQVEIVRALRQCGASVQPLHTVGKGFPDLLVGHVAACRKCGCETLANTLMEIKTDKGALTPDEEEWWKHWNGQVEVARTIEQALKMIGRI